MDKWTVCACVVLLAGAALALPSGSSGRFAEQEDLDSDVEVVGPARGGSRAVARDDESPFDLFGSPGFGFLRPSSLPGFGSFRPVDRRADGGNSGALPGGFIHPFIVNPMSDFMKQMNDMMTAMRRQMDEVLHRLPAEGQDWSKKGNTTSTTKVIDGHVVTVNDTTIADGGEDSGSVIHIRVVDVHPSEDPTAVEGTDAPTAGDKDDSADKDAEDLEEDGVETGPRKQHSDNEIPKKRSVRSPAAARPQQASRRGDIPMAAYQDDDDDTQQAHMPVFGPGDYRQQRTVPTFGRGDFQQQQTVFRQTDSQQQTMPVFEAADYQQRTVPAFRATDSQQQTVPVFGYADSQQQTVPVFGDADSQQQTVPVFGGADSQQQTVPVFERGYFQQQQTEPVFGAAESQQQTAPIFGASDSQQQTVPVFGPDCSQQQQQMRVPAFGPSGVQQQQQRGQMRMMDPRPQRPGYNQVEVFDSNAGARQGDLSRDTLVNSLLEQQHSRAGLIMIDPDAELMDVRNGKVVATYVPAPRRDPRRTP